MVIHKRLDYGSSGYQVPAMPHVPRSAKGKRSARKKIEVNPLSAFDLLATVAGKLLDAENSSPLPDHTAEKDNSKQETMDKGKSPEVEVFDRRSCNRSTLAPEGPVHRQGNYSASDHPQTSNTVSGHSSILIKSDKPDKDAFAGNSMFTDTRVELGHCLGMIPEKCSRDVRSPDSMESCKNNLEEIIKTPLRAEGKFSGIKTVVGNALGLYASEQAMDVDTKPPALVSSDSSVEIALCGNHTGNISIPMCGEHMEHDDDENSSGCTHPKTTTSKTIKAQCVGGRRVRKLLGSKYWKATPTMLKEGDLSDTEMKPVYRGRKICYTRQRTERSSFKRRKLCEHILLSTSDGGMTREAASNSPTKGSIKLEAIDSHEIHGVSGASSSTDQKSSYEAGDHNVKFSIKSFKVPEIFIEIPESATVGSLKKTVMEAVTAMLGSGLRVGVLQQGKKVRDDSKTLIQAGMSHVDKMENLGFTLEPISPPTRAPPLLTNPEDFLPPYDTPKRLIRFPAVSPPPAQVSPIASLQPPLTTLVNCLESDNDSAQSPVDMSSLDKTAGNSKALVPVPAMSVEALAVVPLRKSRHAELAQRRIRRPFSVAEVEALVQAVEKLGTGRWRDVKLRAFENAKHRTYVDLKDKWKTLVHTARISPQQRRGEPVPQELLDRVLAAHAYWSQQQAKLQIKSPPAEACLLF